MSTIEDVRLAIQSGTAQDMWSDHFLDLVASCEGDYKIIWAEIRAKHKSDIPAGMYRDAVSAARQSARRRVEAAAAGRDEEKDRAAFRVAVSLGMPITNRMDERLRPGARFAIGNSRRVIEGLRMGSSVRSWYVLWRSDSEAGVMPVKAVLRVRRDLWFMPALEAADPSPAVSL